MEPVDNSTQTVMPSVISPPILSHPVYLCGSQPAHGAKCNAVEGESASIYS